MKLFSLSLFISIQLVLSAANAHTFGGVAPASGDITGPYVHFRWIADPRADRYWMQVHDSHTSNLIRHYVDADDVCDDNGICTVSPAIALADGRASWSVGAVVNGVVIRTSPRRYGFTVDNNSVTPDNDNDHITSCQVAVQRLNNNAQILLGKTARQVENLIGKPRIIDTYTSGSTVVSRWEYATSDWSSPNVVLRDGLVSSFDSEFYSARCY